MIIDARLFGLQLFKSNEKDANKALKAGMVHPNISKIYLPTSIAILAIAFFLDCYKPSVSLIKIGIFTNRFIMAKKAINTVTESLQIFCTLRSILVKLNLVFQQGNFFL
jgi:hypothetical protein